ncbi:MAG: tetratricopeptide repeat protein [Desulfobacteraceae bacterium]|nr:tetratricopeptide repeat protein [Desulfobacteraceae bacterium]
MDRFLNHFGLNRDSASLTQLINQVRGEKGSYSWFIARDNFGKQLYNTGRYTQAEQVFREILEKYEKNSYSYFMGLHRVGRCLELQGQTVQAIDIYQQGLLIANELEMSEATADNVKNEVKYQKGILQTDLGDALKSIGNYDEARTAYEQSLIIKKELDDLRGETVAKSQLGTLAIRQNNLEDAKRNWSDALVIAQKLREPKSEAAAWHQLGRVYAKDKQWDEAEYAYRKSANIFESIGNLPKAASTWNQLAIVMGYTDKYENAEDWYRKAIEGGKAVGDNLNVSMRLSNLADLLLKQQPNRLQEARELAEEALAIKEILDPIASEIWRTYHILAEIAYQQKDVAKAQKYRRLGAKTMAEVTATTYRLSKFKKFISLQRHLQIKINEFSRLRYWIFLYKLCNFK